MFLLFLGFLLGALAVIVAEGLAIFALLNRLSRKRSEPKATESEVGRDLDVEQSLDFVCNKKVSSRGEMGFEFHGFFFFLSVYALFVRMLSGFLFMGLGN